MNGLKTWCPAVGFPYLGVCSPTPRLSGRWHRPSRSGTKSAGWSECNEPPWRCWKGRGRASLRPGFLQIPAAQGRCGETHEFWTIINMKSSQGPWWWCHPLLYLPNLTCPPPLWTVINAELLSLHACHLFCFDVFLSEMWCLYFFFTSLFNTCR